MEKITGNIENSFYVLSVNEIRESSVWNGRNGARANDWQNEWISNGGLLVGTYHATSRMDALPIILVEEGVSGRERDET